MAVCRAVRGRGVWEDIAPKEICRQLKNALAEKIILRHYQPMEKLIAYLEKPRWRRKEKDFAAKVGISQSRLSKIKAGAEPSILEASKIASATGGRVPMSAWVKKEDASV